MSNGKNYYSAWTSTQAPAGTVSLAGTLAVGFFAIFYIGLYLAAGIFFFFYGFYRPKIYKVIAQELLAWIKTWTFGKVIGFTFSFIIGLFMFRIALLTILSILVEDFKVLWLRDIFHFLSIVPF